MPLNSKASFTIDPKELQKEIHRAVFDQLKNNFNKIKTKLEDTTRNLVLDGIRKQSPYEHILNGVIKNELGLTDEIAQGFIQNLEDLVKKKIKLYYAPGQGKTIATITLDILVLDLKEIYSIPESSYISEPSGSTIEWAKWTLEEGVRIIVSGFQTSKEGTSIKSRSNSGMIMMMAKDGAWRMRKGLSGTLDDNYIIKGAMSNMAKIEAEMMKQIMSIFR